MSRGDFYFQGHSGLLVRGRGICGQKRHSGNPGGKVFREINLRDFSFHHKAGEGKIVLVNRKRPPEAFFE